MENSQKVFQKFDNDVSTFFANIKNEGNWKRVFGKLTRKDVGRQILLWEGALNRLWETILREQKEGKISLTDLRYLQTRKEALQDAFRHLVREMREDEDGLFLSYSDKRYMGARYFLEQSSSIFENVREMGVMLGVN
ncbi:hypothetical protein HY496_03065 [Candidatus Woesearchaeota archaeon]|nr:hypothetical protein [Candidatus Woesearchaeota archaeon]